MERGAMSRKPNTGPVMRTSTLLAAVLIFLLVPAALPGAEVDGIVKIGGVFIDETGGDLSVFQETYNLYEKLTIAELGLRGTIAPEKYFSLNLRDITLDNRKAAFDFRIPGLFKCRALYDQHRQVFDADRATVSRRKDSRLSVDVTPLRWLDVSAAYGIKKKTGERASYPAGVQSSLGGRYDNLFQSGRVEGRARYGPGFLSVAYDFSDLSNNVDSGTDRRGRLVSARAFFPTVYLTDKLTHSVRAAWGKHDICATRLAYTLLNFQYYAEARPHESTRLGYTFYANRVDDEATGLKTDNFRHGFDGTYYHRYGNVFAGYSYEINDDDRTLTSYNVYRVGGSARYKNLVHARVRYSSRTKEDEENRTLLKDFEAESFRGDLTIEPVDGLTVGGRYFNRDRDLPDIHVEIEGNTFCTFAAFTFRDWGSLRADYTYSKNKYDDRTGSFKTLNHTVTSCIQVDYVEDLSFSAGVAYIDVGKDLDIEKSTLFFESRYTFRDKYHAELKYDVYNFDDYVLVDRYYTANVVWINVGYSFEVW